MEILQSNIEVCSLVGPLSIRDHSGLYVFVDMTGPPQVDSLSVHLVPETPVTPNKLEQFNVEQVFALYENREAIPTKVPTVANQQQNQVC